MNRKYTELIRKGLSFLNMDDIRKYYKKDFLKQIDEEDYKNCRYNFKKLLNFSALILSFFVSLSMIWGRFNERFMHNILLFVLCLIIMRIVNKSKNIRVFYQIYYTTYFIGLFHSTTNLLILKKDNSSFYRFVNQLSILLVFVCFNHIKIFYKTISIFILLLNKIVFEEDRDLLIQIGALLAYLLVLYFVFMGERWALKSRFDSLN